MANTQSTVSTPSVEVEHVDFAYDNERNILTDVSFFARPGQLVAIMGGSGSGKTTLLKLISGQIKAQKGEIKLLTHSLKKIKQSALYRLRQRLGMLFQFGALFTDLSVFDNVAFPLREHTNLSSSMVDDLVTLKLHAVGLRGAGHLMPGSLSGGMARRVALARSIALDPEIILYDEPFAGLDPISRGLIGQLIKQLGQALNATSIMVTHDVDDSFAIADYVYFVANGRIAAHGTPEALRKSENPVVKQFIYGLPDGPVPFHYPAPPLAEQLNLAQVSTSTRVD